MEDLNICRICLRFDAKVYKFNQFRLKSCYQELTALIIQKDDVLPHYFCYECAILLHKFSKFRQKCFKGQQELRALLVRGKITQGSTTRFKGLSYKPTLEILTVNERVKTFTMTDREATKSIHKTIEKATSTEAVICDNNDKSEKNNEDKECEIQPTEIITICPKLEPTKTPLNPEDRVTGDTDGDYNSPRENPTNNFTTEFTNTKELKTEVVNEDEEEDTFIIEINGEDTNSDVETNLLEVAAEKDSVIIKNGAKKNVTDKEVQQSQKKQSVRRNCEERKYRFTMRKRKTLDLNKWRIISLSNEEALREFENKSTQPKYAQATYNCTKCYKFFSTEDIMKRHMKLKHDASIGRFECRFCHTRFPLEYHMKRHIRIHYTKYQCLVCHLVVAIEATALMHEEAHSGVMRTCKYCGVEFRHITSYYTHLRTHRTRHVCSTCGASFVSEAGLHQHRRMRHVADDQPKPQPIGQKYCERCQIAFDTPSAYEEHLNSSSLHAEVAKSDNEEIPAPKKRYRSRAERKTWKKPTTCNQCGKHFASQAQCMTHHQKEHPRTPFYHPNERIICETCGASLAPGSIATHNNTHTKEKMYSCKTCGREFSTSTSLKRHQVTHTGEKPFKCPLCDKRFTQDCSMKLHYRTFHLKEPYPKRNRSKKKEMQRSSPIESEEDSL